MIVGSYRFPPPSFRLLYEGVGPFHGKEVPVWAQLTREAIEVLFGSR